MATSDDDLLKRLASVPIFQGLAKKDLQTILRLASVVDHAAGKVIVSEGAEGAVGFHLILEGQASVTVGGQTRSQMGPGEGFGEIALIDGGPRSATVTAVTPTRTLSISAWSFRPLLQEQPGIAYALLLTLCRRLRAAEAATTV